MSKYKLVPVEPTQEMIAALKDRIGVTNRGGLLNAGHALAHAIAAAPDAQMEVVGWQFYEDGKWWNGDDRIKDHKRNTQEAGFRIRDVYAITGRHCAKGGGS